MPTLPTFLYRQSISIVKATLEAAQVICVADDFPSVENDVGLTDDGASRVAGNHERVEGTTFLRIDDLHYIPTLGWVRPGLVCHGNWMLFPRQYVLAPEEASYTMAK